jgi:hypothetical protein
MTVIRLFHAVQKDYALSVYYAEYKEPYITMCQFSHVYVHDISR